MDGKKMHDPLLVTVAKKTIPALTTMDAKKPIPFAVWQASNWALFTACFTVLSPALAYALAHYDASCSECVALTDAQKAELSALWLRMLCCAALQAAAAALALLLPCRPWVRSALAVLALAVTIVGHYMHVVTPSASSSWPTCHDPSSAACAAALLSPSSRGATSSTDGR